MVLTKAQVLDLKKKKMNLLTFYEILWNLYPICIVIVYCDFNTKIWSWFRTYVSVNTNRNSYNYGVSHNTIRSDFQWPWKVKVKVTHIYRVMVSHNVAVMPYVAIKH